MDILSFSSQILGVKHVEFLRSGEFVDMNGRKVSITSDDLDKIVQGFSENLAGQDVPIDVDHERAQAAGWVKKVWREGEKLLAEVDWNKVGRELVGEKVYRYLSATVNISKGVLLSISLVNFPAVKGLAPVELSEGEVEDVAYFLIAPDESMQDRMNRVYAAFSREYPRPEYTEEMNSYPAPEFVILDVLDDYIVVRRTSDDAQLRMGYGFGEENEIIFSNETTPVRRAWIAVEQETDVESSSADESNLSATDDEINQIEEGIMPTADDQIEEAVVTEEVVAEEVTAELSDEANEDQAELDDNVSEIDVAELKAQVMEEVLSEFRAQMTDDIRSFEKGRNKIVADVLAELREEQSVAQQVSLMTSTGANALPFKAEELVAELSELPAPVRNRVLKILKTIHESGTVDFSEYGHQREMPEPEGHKESLDAATDAILANWVSGGNDVQEFFELNPELGSADQYDLSAYEEEDNG